MENIFFLTKLKSYLETHNSFLSRPVPSFPANLCIIYDTSNILQTICDDSMILQQLYAPLKMKQDNILNKINKYLMENCPHVWTKDYIDINEDKGKNIKYCSICFSNAP